MAETSIHRHSPPMESAALGYQLDLAMAETLTPTDAHQLRATAIEQRIREIPGALVGKDSEALCPVSHSFADGCYIREMTCPAGVVAVTKLHKTTHPFFVLEGECSVLTEHGVERIKAPYHGITLAGTIRVVYVHADTRWVAVHVTDETDLAKIEEQVISEELSSLEISDEDVAQLLGVG